MERRGHRGRWGPKETQGTWASRRSGYQDPRGQKGIWGLWDLKARRGRSGSRGSEASKGPWDPQDDQVRRETSAPQGSKATLVTTESKGIGRRDRGQGGEEVHIPYPKKCVLSRFNRIQQTPTGELADQVRQGDLQQARAYYFTYHITVFSRNVKVALVRNGVKVIHTMDNYQSSEDQAAGGAVLHLEKGDKVWLQVAGGELFNGLFADEDDDTTFSGFLLFGAE